MSNNRQTNIVELANSLYPFSNGERNAFIRGYNEAEVRRKIKESALNLKDLEQSVLKTLEKETPESMSTWLEQNRKEKRMYIVQYTTGAWDNHCEHKVFMTSNEETAIKYCEKFNAMRERWRNYFIKLKESGKEDKPVYDRAYVIMEVGPCTYYSIPMR